MGYTQHKTGNYAKAIRNLQEVSGQDNEMGQAANYYLGEAYLRVGDRASARASFGNAKRMNMIVRLPKRLTSTTVSYRTR